jgi:hypothetical protein
MSAGGGVGAVGGEDEPPPPQAKTARESARTIAFLIIMTSIYSVKGKY